MHDRVLGNGYRTGGRAFHNALSRGTPIDVSSQVLYVNDTIDRVHDSD